MTQHAEAVTRTEERQVSPLPVTGLAVAIFVATTALTIYGADDRWEIAIVLAGIVASLVGIYGYLLPRKLAHDSAGGTALTLSSIAALLLLPTFWSGQSLILGAAGALLGYAGRKAPTGAGKSRAAFIVGLLAMIGYFTIYILDAILPPGTA